MEHLSSADRKTGKSSSTPFKGNNQKPSERCNRYQSLYNKIPYPCFTVATTGEILDANRFACDYLDYSVQDLLQKTIFSIFHPEERQRLHSALSSCLQSLTGSITEEFRQVTGSGKILWMKLTFDILQPTELNPLILIFCEDLTERKRKEESFEQIQSRFQLLLDSFPGKISYIDAQKRYQLVSKHYRDWSLISPEDILGKTVEEFMSPQQYQEVENYVELTLSGNKVSYEFNLIFNDGKRRHLLVDQVPHITYTGEVLDFFVFCQDITERKQAEEQVEASLRDKEVLLQEIHHRVKNNLQIISSLLDLQSQRLQDGQILELFQESQNRIKSMALLHQELYLSGNLDRINFADYIYSLINHLIQTYCVNSFDVNVELNIEDVVLDINTAIPCGLILNELISNAFKHAFPRNTQGTIWVEVKLENDQIALVVRDNGAGFATAVEVDKVNSLGLELVKALTQQIQGQIEVERDRGTTFTIKFSNV
jgi:PAS domain S-box-containing protein